jgi:hypothetical protein
MPLLQAAPAAGDSGVLGNEDRVVPHRGLFPVVRRIGGSDSFLDELLSVRHHCVKPLALQVFPFSGTQVESTAEVGSAQSLKDIIQVASHVSIPADRHLVIGQDVVTSIPKTPASSLLMIGYGAFS